MSTIDDSATVFEPSEADVAAKPPCALLTVAEAPRVVLGVQMMLATAPLLGRLPRGDGHPVLVLPGLSTGDASTIALRQVLHLRGFRPYKWYLGRNVGPTAAVRAELPVALARIARRNREQVSVIGWSLGGIYARELAHKHPEHIRQVITLASPYRVRTPSQTRAAGIFERFSHLHTWEGDPGTLTEKSPLPLPVPSTSMYSKEDGLVAWQHCIEPEGPMRENIRVLSSHLSIGFDPYALYAICERLAQPKGEWSPFVPPDRLAPFFPPPDNPHQEVPDVV